MGAQHQIGRADGRPGEGVANALTHPVISINRKRQKHCDVLCRANNFLFSRRLASILPVDVFFLLLFLTTATKLGE